MARRNNNHPNNKPVESKPIPEKKVIEETPVIKEEPKKEEPVAEEEEAEINPKPTATDVDMFRRDLFEAFRTDEKIVNDLNKLNTFYDMHRYIIQHFPLDSYYFNLSLDAIKKYYTKKHPIEYILCSEKEHRLHGYDESNFTDVDVTQTPFVWMNRASVELNPDYIQHVCGGIVVVSVGDNDYRIILLRRKHGQSKGKLTLVQGHVAYNGLAGVKFQVHTDAPKTSTHRDFNFSSNRFFYDIIKKNLEREINEEIDFNGMKTGVLARGDGKLLIIPPDTSSPESISYYHMGYVYMVMIDPYTIYHDLSKIKSAEPDVNDVVIINPNDYKSKHDRDVLYESMDEWLQRAVDFFSNEYQPLSFLKYK